MGDLRKQGISNSIIIYLGVILGYINVVLLFPKFFTQDQFGLTRVLLTVAQLIGLLGQFGFNNVTIKYFPYFKENGHQKTGFFLLVLLVPFIGFLVVSGLVIAIKPLIVDWYAEKSGLFVQNFYWVFPLAFFLIFFNALREFTRALYQTILPVVFRDIIIRLLIMAFILLTIFQVIDFQAFLYLFVLAHAVPIIGYFIYFYWIDLFSFKPKLDFINFKLLKEMFTYGFFSLGNRFSGILSSRVDILMLASYVGTGGVAIYTIAFYIGNVVLIPSKGLKQIGAPKIADAFANNRQKEVESIYEKSALNQLIVGSFVFLIIWASITPILQVINPDYLEGKYVVFFIGFGKLINMATGLSNLLLLHSRYFRSNLYFSLLLLGFTVLFNFLLIPKLQIVGAAIGTASALLIVNGLKITFIWIKMGYHPFSLGMLKVILIIAATGFIAYFLPEIAIQGWKGIWDNLLTIIYRSILLAGIFGLGILLLKPSEDIHEMLVKAKQRILG